MFSHRIGEATELRLPDLSHAEEVTEVVLRNLAHLRPWMPWAVEGYTVESARDFIQLMRRQYAAGESLVAFIFHEGRFAGSAGLNGINWQNRKGEIGYWLDARLQGRGIITRSCRAFVNHSFRDLKLNRVEMFIDPENARSRAVAARLGFRQEGVCRQAEWLHDRFHDLALYAMLAEEWKDKVSSSEFQVSS